MKEIGKKSKVRTKNISFLLFAEIVKKTRRSTPKAQVTAPRRKVPEPEDSAYAVEVVGLTDRVSEHNPVGKEVVLIKFSDDSVQSFEKTEVHKKFPLLLIHHYEKFVTMHDKETTVKESNGQSLGEQVFGS